METATINYRVADFLKKYPPFHAMDEGDLLDLAGRGRVKFFETNEFIIVQGASYMYQLSVIQQGTITLWDEERETAQLQDVRGAGDFLGIEQFNGVKAYPYTARAASDVVVYIFPADDFETLVLKYEYARQYVAAYSFVSADYRPAEEHRDPKDVFIHEVVTGKPVHVCDSQSSIREAARQLLQSGGEALAVLGPGRRPQTVLTADSFLQWIASGTGGADEPVASLPIQEACVIAANVSVADAALELSSSATGALALTEDGSAESPLQAIVTPRDLIPVFGDHPAAILKEIDRASAVSALRDLNQRARSFVLRRLTSASSVEWLARFTALADAGIVKRLVSLNGAGEDHASCWCFSGPAGRGESLTRLAPELVMILDEQGDAQSAGVLYRRVAEGLAECGYFASSDLSFDHPFHVAGLVEWKRRFADWIRDPVLQNIHQARRLFDLRPIYGNRSLWSQVDAAVRESINNDFLYLVANDCLESLPPLTFYQDAVIAESGEESAVFRLEYSALGPLVDVGRVFGMASGNVLGTSTLERLTLARTLLPDHSATLLEAADAFRVVLWQQGRAGISQNTDGSALPPALLGRYDRQLLKSGFRSILRLLEFTGNPEWLATI